MNLETIAHYRIIRKLGFGGMGLVYEAEDTKLGRRVALKFLKDSSGHNAAAMERFLREARAASALNHPGICTIYAIEEYEGYTFIAMELLEGESLDKVLHRGTMPIARSVEICIEVADALCAAHKKGIVHRDIKPANIFLTNQGTTKILDFGLAKLLETEGGGEGDTVGDSETVFQTNRCVHVARAGTWRGAGRQNGSFFVRNGALRNGHRTAPVCRFDQRSDPREYPAHRTGFAGGVQQRGIART
jgi:serine/threonine protein kinase